MRIVLAKLKYWNCFNSHILTSVGPSLGKFVPSGICPLTFKFQLTLPSVKKSRPLIHLVVPNEWRTLRQKNVQNLKKGRGPATSTSMSDYLVFKFQILVSKTSYINHVKLLTISSVLSYILLSTVRNYSTGCVVHTVAPCSHAFKIQNIDVARQQPWQQQLTVWKHL